MIDTLLKCVLMACFVALVVPVAIGLWAQTLRDLRAFRDTFNRK